MWGCMKYLSLVSVLSAVDDRQLCEEAAQSTKREEERWAAKRHRQQDVF